METTARNGLLKGLLVAVALLTLLGGWVIYTDALPWLRGPAPYPPEWRWLHIPLDDVPFYRLALHAGILAVYLVCIGWLAKPDAARWRLLFAAALFTVLWQMAQTWVREEHLFDALIFRTYAPPLNGYFIAPAQVDSIVETLNNYLASMPTFFAHKQQTHPPGPFIFYAVFQEIFVRMPEISEWFAPIARTWAIDGRDWPQLQDHLVTSAFVTAWVQTLLVGLTPFSAYAFVRQLRMPSEERNREVALWTAAMAPLLPSLTLFHLQWDTLYPALALAAWFFALRGQNRLATIDYQGRGQWLDWFWAGLLLSLLTWLSFGTLVIGLMVGLHLLWREAVAFVDHRNRFNPLLAWPTLAGLALIGLGVSLPWLLAYVGWGMNFFALMSSGLAAHYEIVTDHRHYATWLWMNLVDFVLWLGPVPALLGLGGSAWLLLRGWQTRAWRDWSGLAAVVWGVLLVLNFSGTTRGEIGRLWLFLMPFPLMFGLVLPWSYWQRLSLIVLLAGWGWVLTYSIAPFLCC